MNNTADAVYIAALRLLAARDYTEQGLARKLAVKGFEPRSISLSIERLKTEGAINDRRYAENFIASSLAGGRYVGYRLRQELQRRGVPKDMASSEVASAAAESSEFEIAMELVSRRYHAFASEKEPGYARKIASFLQRRGFRSEVIWSVIRRLGEASATGEWNDIGSY